MKFSILAIGKMTIPYCKEGVQEYLKRLRPYATVEVLELVEEKRGSKPDQKEREYIVEAEGKRVLDKIKGDSFVILLDVHGTVESSEEFAARIANLGVQGTRELVLVVGGAYGVSHALRERANVRLSISPMTFTHQMARLIVLEQIYRACKINAKEPYHW